MASTAGQLYIVQRSLFPAGLHFRSFLSSVFPDSSSAVQYAQHIRDVCANFGGETNYTESPFAYTIDSGLCTHKISVQPLRLPDDVHPDQQELGYVVATTSWTTQSRELECPVAWDIRSRFTFDDACETAAVLAYGCTEQSVNSSSCLTVVHDGDGIPHWAGRKGGEVQFAIDVFDRSFDFDGEMGEVTRGLGVMGLFEQAPFWGRDDAGDGIKNTV